MISLWMNCFIGAKPLLSSMAILSQATNALVEGAETTGGIGRLNNQTQRPTQYIGDDIVQPSSKDETS